MCPILWRVACSTVNCKPYGARHPGDLSVLSNFARAAASCPQPQPKRRNRQPPLQQRTAGSEIAAAAYGGMLPDAAAALLHQQNVTSDCHVMSHHACTCMPLARHKLRSYRVGYARLNITRKINGNSADICCPALRRQGGPLKYISRKHFATHFSYSFKSKLRN